MAFPNGYVYHNGEWYNQLTGVKYNPYEQVQDITEAELALLTPSADFIGVEYDVVDRAGGTRVKNTGTAFREVSPGAAEFVTSSTWAGRGTGSFVGQVKRITDLGNNPLIEAMWDGTRWVPRGGRQKLYDLPAPLTGAAGASSQITLPSITIPGGLMGIAGGFEIELHTHTLSSVVTVANTISYTFDGFELFGTDNGTSRRLWFGRRVKNQNSAAVQTVMSNASGSGAFAAATNDPKETTKNTAGDLVLAGTATATHASSVTNRLDEFKVWWI